jgi:hypothetical protein
MLNDPCIDDANFFLYKLFGVCALLLKQQDSLQATHE